MRIRPEEGLNLAFAAIMSALILWKHQRIDNWGIKLAVNLLVCCITVAVSRIEAREGFWFHFRNWYPGAMVPVFFMNLKGFVEGVNPVNWDLFLMHVDKTLFLGRYPELLIEKLYNPLLSEVLQLAYVSYFFIPIILGLGLYRKDVRIFRRSATVIILTFYLSYLGYFLVPAVGPRFAMKEMFHKEIKGLLLTPYLKALLNRLEPTPHDCFPSGHTAVSLACLILAVKYRTRVKILAPMVIGLIMATVYHRYHYVADVLAGILLALVSIPLGERLFELWERER